MRFILSNETFDLNLIVHIQTPRSSCLRELQRRTGHKQSEAGPLNNSMAEGTFFDVGKGTACAIWLRYKLDTARGISTLTHEAVHFARHVMRRTKAYSEETEAYLVQWVVREALIRVYKKKRK